MIAWKSTTPMFGPWNAGIHISPREFDRAWFEEGYRYELVDGVLIVLPSPLENERDPNDELGHLLRSYHDNHPQGSALDSTLPEHTIRTGDNRRKADRVVWAGLGRLPKRNEVPTIVVEFVSEGKRNWLRDYETKRDEYLAYGVVEYWIFDRFERSLTVYKRGDRKPRKRVFRESSTYETDLLPGFELSLKGLFKLTTRWSDEA